MRNDKRLSLIALFAFLVVVAGSVGSCGYSLAGRGNFLPDYIEVISIPEFQNQSDRIELERIVTEKVVEEFNSRGRYRVQAESAGADAELTGIIASFTAAPSVLTGGDPNSGEANQASTYSVVLRAQIEFKDLVGDSVIWNSDNFSFREEYEVGEDPDAFFDQEGLALERLAEEFAKSLVSSILEAF